jgi:hypothetical protein
MSTGGVYFRGDKADLDRVDDLINQIDELPDLDDLINQMDKPPGLEEYLNNMSNENNILKTFLINFIDNSDIDWVFEEVRQHSYSLERLEDNLVFLEIESGYGLLYRDDGEFPSEEWADALSKTFPNLSFFLAGDIKYDGAGCGIYYYIYEDGKCIEKERHCYTDDDIEINDNNTDIYSVLDTLVEYAIDLVRAKAEVWKITENNELLLQKTKELKQIEDRFDNYLLSLDIEFI